LSGRINNAAFENVSFGAVFRISELAPQTFDAGQLEISLAAPFSFVSPKIQEV
jgi:hypothetical protein